MRVVINGLAALKPKTGVGHHVANLAAALTASFPDDEYTLYPGRRLAGVVRRLNRPPVAGTGASRRQTSGLKSRSLALLKATAKAASRFHFRAYTRAYPFDLYHEPNFVPFPSGLPTVVTVHDLSVIRYPEWHPADRVRMHEKRFTFGLGQAAHVIVVSEAVRQETIAELGVPADRVTAVPNGVGPAFRPLPAAEVDAVRVRLGLPQRYFLCVGTIEPRKNIGTAMRAFADLPDVVRDACPLVLAGPWGWKSEADRKYYEGVGRDRGVRHLGYVADADLPALYTGAVGLVYPSHYEGFGIPPLEMMACGGAVLASTAEAVREVCGPHAAFIEPEDLPGWRAALLRLATDAEYRDGLRRGGIAHAATFTWERVAQETIAVYRHVLAPTASEPALSSRPAA
ncbi:MAG TPA: glycosyltransferase family 1 protein [Fimbriiglobus sp.]|jgi:alpha-1,3-rhamnosyl/mannosyltransferase|nr:glycosyltransferase family 1 protein [Fimbriiglobus sp.]